MELHIAARVRAFKRSTWIVIISALVGIALIIGSMTMFRDTGHSAPLGTEFTISDPQPTIAAMPTSEATPLTGQLDCAQEPGINELVIPVLCIHVKLSNIVVSGGELVIPSSNDTAGLWSQGASLTATRGTTLIAGHVDTEEWGPGAFLRLHEVQLGMGILVRDSDGTLSTWQIVASKNIPRDTVRKTFYQLFPTTGQRLLSLVTCGGPLTRGADGRIHYPYNVKVDAQRVS